MPKKRVDPDTVSFTITLPRKAADYLEQLVPEGVYGASRAEVAKMLIQRELQELLKANVLRR